MIKILKGSIFDSISEAYVNPVNCVGIMGKGLALEFKKRYIDNFKKYKLACDNGEIKIGKVFIYRTNLKIPKYIINFPTKDHWSNCSKLEYIEKGLIDLKQCIDNNNIMSIALPALGCGLGGLEQKCVIDLIDEYLVYDDVVINLYLYV